MKKEVRMISYSYMAINSKAFAPWIDVWLVYKIKRKTISDGPCFICGVDNDLLSEIKLKKEFPDYADEEHLNELLEVKKAFDSGVEFAIGHIYSPGLFDIYINRPTMTKKDVEDATKWYLSKIGVLKGEAKFRWKRPRLFFNPA